MESLILNGTAKRPSINFNNITGKFEIKGRSIPEDAVGFYLPVFEWIDQYVRNPHAKTEFNIKMDYFNTSSSKCLSDIFVKLETIKATGKSVVINWYYEKDNEDMLEVGAEFSVNVGLPFKMICGKIK